MRLLRWTGEGPVSLVRDLPDDERPPYAILSHTWAEDNNQEVTFAEVETEEGRDKTGYQKIRFCAEQARKGGIEYFWVDTCCIDKTNLVELSESITSMYRWYQEAVKCYVYLPDVSYQKGDDGDGTQLAWLSSFRKSRWFTRGWTLQELLAPKVVEFFSCEQTFLGDKNTLAQQIHKITAIPVDALRDTSLSRFSVTERMRWAEARQTKKPEDRAYCLLGIFDVSMGVIYGEGEKKAFRRLQREVQDQTGNTAQSPHVHWAVPRTANPLFTGRDDLLQDLEETVRDAVDCPWDRAQCRIVISGLGGQGKSELCLQLARRLRQMFWAVLWIDVSTTDNAERSFSETAQMLSLPAQHWKDALYGLANLQHPWLLILDNADDPKVDYLDYFPDSQHGVVLMTTRNEECRQYSTDQAVALEGLETDEAQQLLLKAARIPPNQHSRYNEDARCVAKLLQSHPLALVQAGAYVARGHCTLADYPRVYERQRQRLLTFRPTQARSRYGDVYATFEVSAEMLRAMDTPISQDALQLLPLLAVCGPSQFPLWLFQAGWEGAKEVSSDMDEDAEDENVSLLTPWHAARLPAVCDAASETWDAYQLVEAVGLLKAFSLVSTDAHHDSVYVSFHALVHAWARDRQEQPQHEQAWLRMGCLTAFALHRGELSQDQARSLQPHVEALVSWSIRAIFSTGPAVLVARILVRCGWYLLDRRADAKLFVLLHEVFVALNLDRLVVERRWIGLYDLLGQSSLYYGRIKDAVAILREVAEICKQTLAEDHPNRLASQYALARAYQDNREVEEAVVLFEHVVEIQKQTLAEDHPNRLASQHALAMAYRANGQVKEAVALLEQVVKIREQTQAKDHLNRLASQSALAMAYRANGQVKEAVALLKQVVEICKQTLAEDHPDRLGSQLNLAIYIWDMGQRDTSLSLLTQVVNSCQRVLDEHHPVRQLSERWFADLEQEMVKLN